ncbi:MAG TPA: beta-propeller fold lactonase family protein [Thermoleophilaceae bacterium]
MSGRRTLMALLVTAAAWLAFQGVAAAGPDQLTYRGCFANDDGVAGCTALAGAPLGSANGVAVSPDGGSVYVASYGSHSITRFARSAAGELAFGSCLANDGPAVGCGDLPYDSLNSANDVAVSPDGKSVYVVSSSSDTLAHFLAAGEKLTYDGCLGDTADYNCGDLPGLPIDSASGVTVSPDGKSVYVASAGSNSVAHFFRSGTDGQVVYDGCLGSTGVQGCGDLDGTPLNGATGVAVSPDGTSIYVASRSSNSISSFQRTGAEGQIGFGSCLSRPYILGCDTFYAGPLSGAKDVVVSRDGTSVYVAVPEAGAVIHFRRNDVDGKLKFGECYAALERPLDYCTDLPGAPTLGAGGLALSPDGGSLYVSGSTSESVAWFSRAAGDGKLSFEGCVSDTDTFEQGCADLPDRPLRGAQSIAVSPDGRSVYVASEISNSVARFDRELADQPGDTPTGSGGQGGQGGSGGTPPAATCNGKRATIVGTKRADRLRGTPGRDVVAALGGNDRVAALGGNDVVCGGRGKDTLRGGRGRDQLAGGPQRDTCIGGAARDRARTCEIRKSL